MIAAITDIVKQDIKRRFAQEVYPWPGESDVNASSIANCIRQSAYKLLGYEGEEIDAKSICRMHDGHYHESDMLVRLIHAGFDVYGKDTRIHIQREGYTIGGHIDGIISADFPEVKFRALLEIRASNSFVIALLEKYGLERTTPSKFTQIQLYLADSGKHNSLDIPSLDWCLFITKNPDNPFPWYMEIVSRNLVHVNSVLDKTDELWNEYLPKKELPPQEFAHDSGNCKRCEFRLLCRKIDTEGFSEKPLNGEELIESPLLDDAAYGWRKGKIHETTAKQLIDDARKLFQDTLIKHEAKSMLAFGLRASIGDSGFRLTESSGKTK